MPTTPRRALPVALLALVALTAAACGGGDSKDEADATTTTAAVEDDLTADEQAYADVLADKLTDGSGARFEDPEAECMAGALMGEIGVEPFQDADLTPEDVAATSSNEDAPGQLLGAGAITDEQADAILDAWYDCADVDAAFVANMVTEMEVEGDADKTACLEDAMAETDVIREGYRQTLVDDSGDPSGEVLTEIFDILDGCGVGIDGEASGDGVIVDSIAASMAAGGTVTEEQAQCMAKHVVDAVGRDELLDAFAQGGDFADTPPELQEAITKAVVNAADSCGVPASALGG